MPIGSGGSCLSAALAVAKKESEGLCLYAGCPCLIEYRIDAVKKSLILVSGYAEEDADPASSAIRSARYKRVRHLKSSVLRSRNC